jgi:hypothetical protein
MQKPVITGNVLCSGETATTLRVQTQIEAVPPRYQWYKDGVLLTGATSTWIKVQNIVPDDERRYHCLVSNSNDGAVKSDIAILITGKAQLITDLPATGTATEGEAVTLTIAGKGYGIQYQWYKDGFKLDAATNATLSFTAATAGEAKYRCTITNACGEVSSRTLTLTILQNAPVVGVGAEFMVFPNPAQDYIWVKAEQGKMIVIYDLHGKKVHQRRANNALEKIYVSGWGKGVYQVQIVGFGKEQTIQFIKL